MEVKIYLQMLMDKWWLVLLCFLVTFTATVVLTFVQPLVYQATATFIVTPNTAFPDTRSFLSSLEVLSRRSEIASTYSEVIKSNLIKDMALEELGLSGDRVRGYVIDSSLRAGTNVLQIQVRGTDPALVRDMANVIGEKTMSYISKLYEMYEIKPLDVAKLPTRPISPNKTLYLALGVVLGLALGVGLAFVSQYLQAPLENMVNAGIIDQDTGLHNKQYFMQRLDEEIKRANRQGYPLSVALMNIEQLDEINSFPIEVRREALHKVAVLLKQHLRDQDIVACFDHAVFAFLLTDMDGANAKDAMERLQTRVAWTPVKVEKIGLTLNLNGVIGVSSYLHNGVQSKDLLDHVRRAMEEAQDVGYGQVYLVSENDEKA